VAPSSSLRRTLDAVGRRLRLSAASAQVINFIFGFWDVHNRDLVESPFDEVADHFQMWT
jgi:hypothetical protein